MILPSPGGKVGHRRTHTENTPGTPPGVLSFLLTNYTANCIWIELSAIPSHRILYYVVDDRVVRGGDRPGRGHAADRDDRPTRDEPTIPPGIDAKQLSAEIRGELSTLDRVSADLVARHLVAAGELLDENPEAALAHARAARARASRIAAVREAVGIAAYHCGDWSQALAELRAARRMGSKSVLMPLIADCERGVGRPERAIELARSPEAALLTGDDADELRIVAAGARSDLGQLDQALAVLSTPPPDPSRRGQTAARLDYAYAETLLALGRNDEAVRWFLRAAAADIDGVTDAEERVAELA
jgi:tetratricopeptide (TPR) repeat protein